jgi:hypothetical protein
MKGEVRILAGGGGDCGDGGRFRGNSCGAIDPSPIFGYSPEVIESSMHSIRAIALSILLLLGGGVLVPAHADCIDFKWDVSKERALFAAAPTALTAGKDAQSAPDIVPNRLYQLRLVAQDQVAFAATPHKQTPGTFAGLATLKIPAKGSYRIAIDLPFWIDVVLDGAVVPAQDFEGQHSCGPPHKIVEFRLTSVRPFVLQLSNGPSDAVLLTVTASPPRKL